MIRMIYIFRSMHFLLSPSTKRNHKGSLTVWRMLAGLFFFSVYAVPVLAQDPANNYCTNPQGAAEGGFTLDKIRICPNDKISVTGGIPAGLTNIAYIPDYQGKGIPTNSLQLTGIFTYSQPGTYTILQVGSLNGTRSIKCQTVTVLPLDPVQFSLKSCTGRQVTLQPDPATLGQYDTYVINWGDGVPTELSRAELAASPQHTYAATAANTQVVTVEGVYGSLNIPICRSPNQQPVTLAADLTQPIVKALKSTDATTITLQYEVGAASPVQLYQKVNGVYTATGQKAIGPNTFTIKTDARQVQCFKVISQDVCGSTTIESGEVCSLVLDARATNKKNTLDWQPYAGVAAESQFQNYQLTRNDTPLGMPLTGQSTATYTDTDVTCGSAYCYRLVATVGTSSAKTEITSAPACVTGISGSALDALGTVVVSVENDHPSIVTNLPAASTPADYTLVISRSDNGSGMFTPVTSIVGKNTFVDETVSASSGSHCYQVTYQGGCGLGLPPSKPACTIFLSATDNKSIAWTGESPFAPGTVTDYAVELIDSSSSSTTRKSVGSATQYVRDIAKVVYTYRIAATSGGYTSYSNYYTFAREDRFSVPDAFTPNGDQMNDTFLPKGLNTDRFIMTVYSRWGEVVFSTTDKAVGWDGTAKGQPVSQGTYVYKIEVEDIAGQKTIRTGRVFLLR